MVRLRQKCNVPIPSSRSSRSRTHSVRRSASTQQLRHQMCGFLPHQQPFLHLLGHQVSTIHLKSDANYPHGLSVRPHRLGVPSHKSTPTSGTSTNQSDVSHPPDQTHGNWGSHLPHRGFDNLRERPTELRNSFLTLTSL